MNNQATRNSIGNSIPLRLALSGNALFSTVSAIFLIFQPTLVGDWLGFHSPVAFTIIGVALAVFAGELFYQTTGKRIIAWRVLIASCSDYVWVLASIPLLILNPVDFSSTGVLLISAVAIVVCVFGSCQLWGIEHAHKTSHKNGYRLCAAIEVNAPSASMWQVISQLGDIHKYSSGLKDSVVINNDAPGVGAVRVCSDCKGNQWAEECTDFRVGHGYSVRFKADDPKFPFPVSDMIGGWELSSKGEGSEIQIWFELKPKPLWLAPVILSLLAFQLDSSFPKVVQNMANDVCGEGGNLNAGNETGIVARLLPSAC
ncbi:SRPBCC family protein [Rubellicoccus peritrichatus]|uniref:SRPBCC family protein n=1 Tax=Rubellicoccus peritrichatus TaxID=3080537 RepID=A0AAQ3LC18_9BACT|nr:SRPBCC family protein [Puniceicoccus sp. CR14]WOO41799.1 SRPBCC family protein [Puniceicoccus sp. CR14]